VSQRPVILCFAGDVWDGNPHSRHHLMLRFAERFDILFIESVPMRSIAQRDPHEWQRILRKLRARPGVRTVSPGLHVLRPLPIPPAGAVGRAAQLGALRAQIAWACHRLAITGPRIAWFSLPVVAPLLGRLSEHGSLFYYQDRYDSFSHVDAERLRANVQSLARRCDVTVTCATALADDVRALGASPQVVAHGVDIERFARTFPPPTDLVHERPLVGCVGLIDDYLDVGAIRAVAERLERGTLVCVGQANMDTRPLRHPRIALLGPRPYAMIPAYVGAFACCLIPFAINRLTLGVNPIKLREYLAAGRPVVATRLPEIAAYGDVVELVDSPDGFASAVERTLQPGYDSPERRQRRRARVADESWDRAAAAIETQLWRLV